MLDACLFVPPRFRFVFVQFSVVFVQFLEKLVEFLEKKAKFHFVFVQYQEFSVEQKSCFYVGNTVL